MSGSLAVASHGRTHTLHDGVRVCDWTPQKGITISGRNPGELLWMGIGFELEMPDSMAQVRFSNEDDVLRVDVGAVLGRPGVIRLDAQRLNNPDGTPGEVRRFEVDTRFVPHTLVPATVDVGQSFYMTLRGHYVQAATHIARLPTSLITSSPETIEIVRTFTGAGLSEPQRTAMSNMVSGVLLQSDEHTAFMADPNYQRAYETAMHRVCIFEGGVRSFNLSRKAVGTTFFQGPIYAQTITINGFPVRITFQKGEMYQYIPFSRGAAGFCDYVVVRDGPNPNSVLIERHEVKRPGESNPRTEFCYVELDESRRSWLHNNECGCPVQHPNPVVYNPVVTGYAPEFKIPTPPPPLEVQAAPRPSSLFSRLASLFTRADEAVIDNDVV